MYPERPAAHTTSFTFIRYSCDGSCSWRTEEPLACQALSIPTEGNPRFPSVTFLPSVVLAYARTLAAPRSSGSRTEGNPRFPSVTFPPTVVLAYARTLAAPRSSGSRTEGNPRFPSVTFPPTVVLAYARTHVDVSTKALRLRLREFRAHARVARPK